MKDVRPPRSIKDAKRGGMIKRPKTTPEPEPDLRPMLCAGSREKARRLKQRALGRI